MAERDKPQPGVDRQDRVAQVTETISGRKDAQKATPDEAAIAEAMVDLERGVAHAAERLADAVKNRSRDRS